MSTDVVLGKSIAMLMKLAATAILSHISVALGVEHVKIFTIEPQMVAHIPAFLMKA